MKGSFRLGSGALALLGAAFFLSLTVSPALTQGTSRGRADSDVGPYRIGNGDVLRVDVVGRTDLSGSYTVSTDGNLTLPVVGPVPVVGRTAAEVQADLSRRISLFDRNGPQVSVTITEFRSQKIFVLGAVVLPGIYAFAEMPNVWDAIAAAGGPLDDADLTVVEVIPGEPGPGKTTAVVDVAAAIRGSRSETLPHLRPGDTVRVPSSMHSQRSGTVQVFGAISHPGSLPFDQTPDLATAVIRSGGPTADAKLSRVEIIRQDGPRLIHMFVNLDDYFEKTKSSGNPNLEPGDTVFIPIRMHRGIGFMGWMSAVSTVLALTSTIVFLGQR
jgi:polysaccharide export outer membrane protein